MTTQELISARSNEANLGQEEFAWLLFGIHDKTHAVLGSSYKPTRPSLDALKREIAEGTNCGITFTEILAKKQDLSLVEIEALNRIQLNRSISDEEVSHLRKKKLIEGRKPNLFIAKPVAQQLDQKTAYSNNKGFEDNYDCDLILKALTEHGTLTKKEITELLWNKLPDVLSESQKHSKVRNLLTKLRKQDKIRNVSKGIHSDWFLNADNLNAI